MKNKTDKLTAEEARQLFQKDQKPIKVKAEKKVQSGAEQLDLSSSEVSQLIDTLLLKVPQYLEYHEEKITCQHKGYSIEISFKMKKLPPK